MGENNRFLNEKYETGENQLATLIKQAGEGARARKKKALSLHFQKLKAAVTEGVSHRKNHEV